MLFARKILAPIIALPYWISAYAVLIPLLVLLSPSWLQEPDSIYRLDNAFFLYQDKDTLHTNSVEISKQVELPHDWRKNDSEVESGWYEFPVEFGEAIDSTTVIYITHVQQIVDIWVDDIPVSNIAPEYVVSGHMWSRPVLLRLPENALTAGEHTIRVHLQSEPVRNGLLGKVYLGPAKELRPHWEWRYHYRFTSVAIITFGMLSLSLFIGILWLLRKKETMYLWFTICTFFWSLHNIPHIIDTPRVLTPAFWDALYYILLGWMTISLVIFNHRFVGDIYPRREKFLLVFAVLAAIPFFFLTQESILIYAYRFWDLSLLPFGAYTMYYLIQSHQNKPVLEIRLLILAGTIILSFGLRDYLVISGLIDRTQGLLMHFSGFPTMLVLIWFLLSRFTRVLKESESLNLELEQRVLTKEKELQDNFDRLKTMEQEQLLSDERSRIMQDVHDGVGGQLVAMLAEIETGRISQEQVSDALSQSLTDLRLVIDSLDVASEDIPTLLGMLRTRLQPRLDGHDIQLHWGVQPLPGLNDFGPRKALQLMRILQEIFVNILKHSKAKNIYLTTEVLQGDGNSEQIEIIIRDDGSWREPEDSLGHGLKNMRRRAESIAAELEITGDKNGTSVKIILSSNSDENRASIDN
jgi:signal transduction histidine kinase